MNVITAETYLTFKQLNAKVQAMSIEDRAHAMNRVISYVDEGSRIKDAIVKAVGYIQIAEDKFAKIKE